MVVYTAGIIDFKIEGVILSSETIKNPEVQFKFDSYPEAMRNKFMDLRELIYEVAAETDGVGQIEETLKWGQISYLTHHPKSGTTIRIDEYQPESQQIAFFVHCQTSLVDTYREMVPNGFHYEGTRAVFWDNLNNGQIEQLKDFIELALTYHRRKRI